MVGRRLRNATEKLVDTFKWQERVQQMNISKHLSLRAINEHLLSMRTHTERHTRLFPIPIEVFICLLAACPVLMYAPPPFSIVLSSALYSIHWIFQWFTVLAMNVLAVVKSTFWWQTG